MTTVNFRELKVFDLSKKECTVIDIREQLANLVYNNGYGVVGHILAHKIYASEGEIELTDAEAQALEPVVMNACTAPFIDAIISALGKDPAEIIKAYTPKA